MIIIKIEYCKSKHPRKIRKMKMMPRNLLFRRKGRPPLQIPIPQIIPKESRRSIKNLRELTLSTIELGFLLRSRDLQYLALLSPLAPPKPPQAPNEVTTLPKS